MHVVSKRSTQKACIYLFQPKPDFYVANGSRHRCLNSTSFRMYNEESEPHVRFQQKFTNQYEVIIIENVVESYHNT